MRGRGSWDVEDLEVFKRAYDLSLELHRVSLDLPKIEQFGGLADQLRRASKSVCALMAEGAGRQQGSSREFARYLVMALGSAEEVRLWCRYGVDLGYVEAARAERWRAECRQIIRMLHGLKSSVAGS
jgi:four helix bundle protein